jgi:anti-anti-sigma regulatory factor
LNIPVAFSIFNKKGNEPPTPPGRARSGVRATRADGPRPVPDGKSAERGSVGSRVSSGEIDRIEAEMAAVDIPEELARAASARAGAKPIVEHGFQGGGKARPASKSSSAPRGSGAAPQKDQLNSVMMMEIQESPFESAPALEEAAILYANRQDGAAQSALEEAVQAEDIPHPAARQAWLMLFDLFENQGRRTEFEAAAIKFAVRFETSPPAFSDRSEVKTAARATTPTVTLSGKLDETAAKQFDHLRAMAGRHRALRIDLTKIERIAPEGSDQLRASLATLKKSGHDASLAGADQAIVLLCGQIETGRADIPQTYWLLLLDLYQELGMHAEFEDAAFNYCVTYEVSPPSWINPPNRAAKATPEPAADPVEASAEAVFLRGEIEGNAEAALKGVAAHAAEKNAVVIDICHLKRMDFIAAGSLLNLVATLKSAGKHVEIRSPSPLLATLFVTMGFTAYAKMARRKQ